jgi:hypothetical protein
MATRKVRTVTPLLVVLLTGCAVSYGNPPSGSPSSPSGISPSTTPTSSSPPPASNGVSIRELLKATEGEFSRILVFSNRTLDRLGKAICQDAKNNLPVDREEVNALALTLQQSIELTDPDAIRAVIAFLVIYCPELKPAT